MPPQKKNLEKLDRVIGKHLDEIPDDIKERWEKFLRQLSLSILSFQQLQSLVVQGLRVTDETKANIQKQKELIEESVGLMQTLNNRIRHFAIEEITVNLVNQGITLKEPVKIANWEDFRFPKVMAVKMEQFDQLRKDLLAVTKAAQKVKISNENPDEAIPVRLVGKDKKGNMVFIEQIVAKLTHDIGGGLRGAATTREVTVTGGIAISSFPVASGASKGGVDVANTTTEIVPANPSRVGLIICNQGTQDVWIAIGEAAVIDEGHLLAKRGGIYVERLGDGDLHRGAINGVTSTSTSRVTFIEKTA